VKKFFIALIIILSLNTFCAAQNISIITDSVIFLPNSNNDYNKFILKKADLERAKLVQCKLGKIVNFEVTFSIGGSIVVKQFSSDRIDRATILLLKEQQDGTKVYFDMVIETDKGPLKRSIQTYLNAP
jgi:hypothetical protein